MIEEKGGTEELKTFPDLDNAADCSNRRMIEWFGEVSTLGKVQELYTGQTYLQARSRWMSTQYQ